MRLIAHRGASAHAPENTLAAFRLALEMGAAELELDVHQTTDGELAILHDWDLRRTGRGLPKGHPAQGWLRRRRAKVGTLSFADLSAADVGSWFSPRFKGERVPRLEDALGLAAGKVVVHVEIKKGSALYPGVERRVVDLIRRRGALGWTVVSSFDHRALFAARAVEPRLRIGYLLGLASMKKALRETRALKAESLHISLRQATPRRLKLAHGSGLQVLVYTVNKAADLARLARIGVDGVFTNFPELSLAPENR